MPLASATRLLQDDEAFGASLLVLCLDELGPEMLGWLPTTIAQEIRDDFAVPILPTNLHKLMAAVAVTTTDLFYLSLPHFISICNALCGSPPGVSFDMADAAECAWGMTEAMLLHPPESAQPFSAEICGYVGHVCQHEGLVDPPDVLRIGLAAVDARQAVQATYGGTQLGDVVRSIQQFRSQEISQMLRSNLAELFGQLESLQLQHGNVQNLLARLQRASAA